jgi:hypothetical protein
LEESGAGINRGVIITRGTRQIVQRVLGIGLYLRGRERRLRDPAEGLVSERACVVVRALDALHSLTAFTQISPSISIWRHRHKCPLASLVTD